MEERLRHRRLIGALYAPIEPIIPRLERHLHKCIGTETVLRDPALPEPLELEHLAVVLADKVRQSRLGEPNAEDEVGRERPFKLARNSDEGCAQWRGVRAPGF
jgi:hypothetical protein